MNSRFDAVRRTFAALVACSAFVGQVRGAELPTDAAFHFDASADGTLVIEVENGTNFVTRWNDADNTDRYATTWVTRPFVGEFNGKPIVDFGTYNNDPYNHFLGYGGSMKWSASDTGILEVFMIYSDVPGEEEWDAPGGSFFLGSCDALNTYHFHRNGRRLFSSDAAAALRNGLIQVDGQQVGSDYELSPGFHLLRFRPTSAVRANAFATDRGTRRGGQKLAEVYVFNRQLTSEEALAVEQSMITKWFGGIYPIDTRNAAFHFDASAEGALVTEEENGTNFVTRWNDADNADRYATTWVTRPFVGELNGKPIVDFGTYNNAPYCNLLGYGGSLKWSATDANIREVFMVYSDVLGEEDWDVPGGPFFLGSCDGLNTYHFHRNGRRLFDKENSWFNGALIRVDGIPRDCDYELPEGFHVMHFRREGAVSANAFATDRGSRRGGQQLAEVYVFDQPLSDGAAYQLEQNLMDKWIRVESGCAVELLNVQGDLCSVEVVGDVMPSGGYKVGTDVTVTVTPKAGAEFVRWYGDVPAGHETDLTLTLRMDTDKSLLPQMVTTWRYDPVGGTLTDGYWTFSASGDRATISVNKLVESSLVGVLDFSKPIEEGGAIANVGVCAFCTSAGTELNAAQVLTDLICGNSLTNIEGSAFRSCRNLRTVRLSDNLKFIGGEAFFDDVALTTVTPFMPTDAVLERGTFFGCEKLEGNLVLASKRQTELATWVLANGKESEYGAFRGTKITSADLSATKTEWIGGHCLRECENLGDVFLPKTLRKINGACFWDSPALSNVVFRSFPDLGIAPDAFGSALGGGRQGGNWKMGTYGRRLVIPAGNELWRNFMATNETFVSWAEAGDAAEAGYRQVFGDKLKPVGYFVFAPDDSGRRTTLVLVPKNVGGTMILVQ